MAPAQLVAARGPAEPRGGPTVRKISSQEVARKRERGLRAYAEFRIWIDKIKVAAGCIDCGWNEDPAALDFDHRDPTLKTFVMSRAATRTRESVLAEIEKCDVRCARCHRVRTARKQDLSKGRPRSHSEEPTLW